MILVAGGQLDPNIGCLLRRVLHRELPFRALLVGPSLTPRIDIDLEAGAFALDGEVLTPRSVFLRHDVFLRQKTGSPYDQAAALNWHHAVRGWFSAQPDIRLLNRDSHNQENNKVRNLVLARALGLRTPPTRITNTDIAGDDPGDGFIQKPAAGGEFTRLLRDTPAEGPSAPRFVQPRLGRPETRIFRVGPRLLAFEIQSAALDYRGADDVSIRCVEPEPAVARPLVALCDALGLDFAAADFMLDAQGCATFLEVNTQPMFVAFDRVADGALCDAILDHLA